MDDPRGNEYLSASTVYGGDGVNRGGVAPLSNGNPYQPFQYNSGGGSYYGEYGGEITPVYPGSVNNSFNAVYDGAGNGGGPYQMPPNQYSMVNMPHYGGPPHGHGFMTHHFTTANGPTGSAIATGAGSGAKKTKKRKRDKDRPKRPLSAYNIFFQDERAKILGSSPGKSGEESGCGERKQKKGGKGDDGKTAGAREKKTTRKKPHGKIGFELLAKEIGKRWKQIDPEGLACYKAKAGKDSERYAKEMKEYEQKVEANKKRKEEEEKQKCEDTSPSHQEPEEEKQKRENTSPSHQEPELSASRTSNNIDDSNDKNNNDAKKTPAYQKDNAESGQDSKDEYQKIQGSNRSANGSCKKSQLDYSSMNLMASGNFHLKGNDAGPGIFDGDRDIFRADDASPIAVDCSGHFPLSPAPYGQLPNAGPSMDYYSNVHPPMDRVENGNADVHRLNNGSWEVDSAQQYQQQAGYGTGNSTMKMGEHDHSYQQQMFSGWNQDTTHFSNNVQGPEGTTAGPSYNTEKPHYDNGFMEATECQQQQQSGYSGYI